MRKKTQSIEAVKAKIHAMLGKNINMSVCRGRKRICHSEIISLRRYSPGSQGRLRGCASLHEP